MNVSRNMSIVLQRQWLCTVATTRFWRIQMFTPRCTQTCAHFTLPRRHIAHLRQECYDSKSVSFHERLLKVLKCYNFLCLQRRHNCSPAASFANCVMTLYLLKVHLQTFLSIPITDKCQILSCDTLVANERHYLHIYYLIIVSEDWKISKLSKPETRYSVHSTGAFVRQKTDCRANIHDPQIRVCKKSKWHISFYCTLMTKNETHNKLSPLTHHTHTLIQTTHTHYTYLSRDIYINILFVLVYMPVPVVARSKGVGLRPLACWDCGFESHRGHGCLSVVSVVCCQVEVSATRWSLIQRSPTYVARRCVWSRYLVNEEALTHWGQLHQKQKKK